MMLTDYDLDPMNNNKRQIRQRRRRGIPATVRGPCPRAFRAYIIIIIMYYIVY